MSDVLSEISCEERRGDHEKGKTVRSRAQSGVSQCAEIHIYVPTDDGPGVSKASGVVTTCSRVLFDALAALSP